MYYFLLPCRFQVEEGGWLMTLNNYMEIGNKARREMNSESPTRIMYYLSELIPYCNRLKTLALMERINQITNTHHKSSFR